MAMMGSWRKKGVIGTPGYSEDTSMNTAPLRIGDAGGVPLLPDGVSDISLGGGEHLASPPRKSFFGKGGAGRDILGGLFDSIISQTGGQPIYIPAKQREYQRQQELDDYNRKRADDLELWRQKQIWERDNPAPANNDTANDYEFWKVRLSPEEFKQYVANEINPPRFTTLPDGRLVMVGGYQPGGGDPASTGQGQPPSTLPPDFDFGEGGQTAGPSGGFR